MMEWYIAVPLWIVGYMTFGSISAFFDVRYRFRKAMKENRNALCEEFNYYHGEGSKLNSKEKQIELNLAEASKEWGLWLFLWPIGYAEYVFKGMSFLIKQGVAGKAIKEAKDEVEKARLDALTAKILKEQDEKFDKELEG